MGRRAELQTEAEWLTTTDPDKLIRYLRQHAPSQVGERAIRLIQVACARRFWDLMVVPQDRSLLLAAEQYAEGTASPEQVRAAYYAATDVFWATLGQPGRDRLTVFVSTVAHHAGYHATRDIKAPLWDDLRMTIGFLGGRRKNGRLSRKEQSDIVRDVVGNPFRPLLIDPAWLTASVVEIARGIYEESAFDRMPILADALLDAGCVNEDVLAHCRGLGPHVRGCHVVDRLLGET